MPELRRGLVLDANILVRGVLGRRVRSLIDQHAEHVAFLAPQIAFDDARRHLPTIADKRGLDTEALLAALDALEELIFPISEDTYGELREAALPRIEVRDPDDWPIVATALALQSPIWTEDQDFFGTGIATWTTDRVHLYLDTD